MREYHRSLLLPSHLPCLTTLAPRIPALVTFCVQCIQDYLRRAPPQPVEVRLRIPGIGATDAGAAKTRAGVGGWYGTDASSKWYQY